ncbi:putative quinol monooxygenase [Halobaculum sp. MBLA0143]|uniref:putative quinol monooxygenase n=1 Tax=Halobaculum sp. MBLA0143 TaxID=3079933 RepID=UPI00352484BE
MIVVHTEIPVAPDEEAAFRDLAAELVARAERAEPDTVRYRASVGVGDRPVARFFEQYADAAAAETHRASDLYRRFNERLPELADGEIETVQFEVPADAVATATFTPEEAAAAVADETEETDEREGADETEETNETE